MYYATGYSSPLGEMMLGSDGQNLVGLWIEEQKYFGASLDDSFERKENLDIFNISKKWLDKYFEQQKPKIADLPLNPHGSQFRQFVWDALCNIPYGQITTYGDIGKIVAKKMGRSSMSGQAIGGAVGHNPISIIIPCHRVVGANGSLTGYAGGIDRKIKLLELEGIDVSQFTIPTKGTAIKNTINLLLMDK
ncbi:methylated-DNA--[protein]-cysteine S-methyltransferase [Fusobacterium sp. PH5-44]|uniref:methylated-DNA--[protein]-cysteine S-methyltransferase n=1 Tax=unclassified Fusobacterium TaxID=2648384 RepID=UPI003D1AA2D8